MRESCLYGSVGGTRFPTAMTIWPGHAAGAACPGRRMHISVRTLLPLATHVRIAKLMQRQWLRSVAAEENDFGFCDTVRRCLLLCLLWPRDECRP